MAPGGINPPRSAAHIIESQTEAVELVGAEVLPCDGLLPPHQWAVSQRALELQNEQSPS